jgi:hypothetical protein
MALGPREYHNFAVLGDLSDNVLVGRRRVVLVSATFRWGDCLLVFVSPKDLASIAIDQPNPRPVERRESRYFVEKPCVQASAIYA